MADAVTIPALEPRSARRIFWLSAASFAVLTALLPPLCFPTFRSDVLEQIVIGREWVLGSAKHPAFTTWIMQIFWVGLGGSRFAPSIAASVCATITLWAVWRLGREYVPEREALIGALCLTAYWYTNLGGAAMYNNNVTLITFWHLAILSFHFALKTNRAVVWIQTGLLLGVGVLCKYSAVILVGSMGVFMVAHADARRRLRTPGPWLAAVAMALAVLPHAIYMAVEFGGSHAYLASKRMRVGLLPFCLILARDVLLQLLIASPILLIVAPLIGWRPQPARRITNDDFSAAFIPAMFGLPLVIQTLVQFVTRVPYLQRSYGSHLWVLVGLCTVFVWKVTADARHWRWAAIRTAALAAVLLASLPVATAVAYRFDARPNVRFYPGQALAETIDAVWQQDGVGACRYLAGRNGDQYASWAAGAFSRHQPHVVDPALGHWAHDADMNVHGGIVVWTRKADEAADGVPEEIKHRFPGAAFRGFVDLPYQMLHPEAPHVHVGIAVVAPQRGLRMAAEPATTRR